LSSTSRIYSSTDGNTWTLRQNGGDNTGGGFAYDGTTFVAGSTTNSSTAAKTSTPADIATWTDRAITAINVSAGAGGAGGLAAGGGGGGPSTNGNNSGAGGAGGNGFVRVYTW
jgi:hypothetical protein